MDDVLTPRQRVRAGRAIPVRHARPPGVGSVLRLEAGFTRCGLGTAAVRAGSTLGRPAADVAAVVAGRGGTGVAGFRRAVAREGHTVHFQTRRGRGATPTDARISTICATARVAQVQAKALAGETARSAESVGAVGVVGAWVATGAGAPATARAVPAGGLAEPCVMNGTGTGRAPRTAVGEGVTQHGADLRAAFVPGANLIRFAAAIGVRFAFVAVFSASARSQLQPLIHAAKRGSVADVLGRDAVGVGRIGGETARCFTRAQARERVRVAEVPRRAVDVVVAAELDAVRVEVSFTRRQAVKIRFVVAVVVAIDTRPAVLPGPALETVGFAERNVVALGVGCFASARTDAAAVIVEQTGHDTAPVDAALGVLRRTFITAGAVGARWRLGSAVGLGSFEDAELAPTPIVGVDGATFAVVGTLCVAFTLGTALILHAALALFTFGIDTQRFALSVALDLGSVAVRAAAGQRGQTERYHDERVEQRSRGVSEGGSQTRVRAPQSC